MAELPESAEFDNTECYVFIDDSNLWIEGQKAQGRKLVDTNIDPRYRTDLGHFLKTVLKQDRRERSITKAFLYGSIPPPNDTLWNAARKKNFEVKVFKKSMSGKEKKVDVAMATDITEMAMEKKYSDSERQAVFIVVTGDKDQITPIELALEKSNLISVELWAWDFSMAREFRQLANLEDRLTVRKLEDVEVAFSYREFKSTHANDINPARAIVFKGVSKSKEFYYSFANDLCRLLRLFYITRTDSVTEPGKQDLIVEFPKSNPDFILRELKRCKIGCEPCSYPEYLTARRSPQLQRELAVTNRFEALQDLDDSEDAFTEVIESSLGLEPEDLISEPEDTDLESKMSDTWISVARHKAGNKSRLQKRKAIPCTWGIHCSSASECPYLHTKQERKIFRVQSHIKFKYWKTKLCNKLQEHSTWPDERQANCSYAHTPKDSWCLRCKTYGHLTDDCKA